MRIGVDATSILDELSGVERAVATVVDALVDLDDPGIELVVFTRGSAPSRWTAGGARVVRLPVRHQAVSTQIDLPRAVRRERVDVLLCPGKPGPAFTRVPVVDWIHDAVAWTQPETMGRLAAPWFRFLQGLAVRRRSTIATGLPSSARALRRHLPLEPGQVHVVGHALDRSFLAAAREGAGPRPAVAPAGPYVLALCRMEPRKNIGLLLDAWPAIHAARPDAELALAGKVGWGVDGLVRRAEQLPGVRLLGFVDDAELPSLYAHASAFVTTSTEEGFGLPLLEAMALGTPVVASAIPPHIEVAGGAAVLVPLDDAAGLAAALLGVLDAGPEETEAAAARGRARAAAFAPERLAARVVAALPGSRPSSPPSTTADEIREAVVDLVDVVDVVVVAYGSEATIEACVRAAQADPAVHQVIVVDNDSPDRSAEIAAAAGAVVVRADTNRGFGAGCNLGVAASSAPLVLLCNPDAEVGPGTVGGLARALLADPSLAAVASDLVDPAGVPEPPYRRRPRLWSAALEPGLAMRLAGKGGRRVDDAEVLPATALLVRRDAYDSVGGFDEGYFLYWEDVDLSVRLHRLGWGLAYEPGFVTTHRSGWSTRRAPGGSRVAWADGFRRYVAAHERRPRALRTAAAAGHGARAVAWTLRGRPGLGREWWRAARRLTADA